MTDKTTTLGVTNSTVRTRTPRPHGAHAVAVIFSTWGYQTTAVDCATAGGRDNKPYIAVRVGECLTYAYDRRALMSYLRAWERAAAANGKIRLPAITATAAVQRPGQDFAIVCNATGWQRSTVDEETSETGARRLLVTIGAVHVRVYAAEGLRSHLSAWTRAQDFAAVFDTHDSNPPPRR